MLIFKNCVFDPQKDAFFCKKIGDLITLSLNKLLNSIQQFNKKTLKKD